MKHIIHCLSGGLDSVVMLYDLKNYLAWLKFLDKVRETRIKPIWLAVPDVVADRRGTLKAWERYSPVAYLYGWPLAFVVQDGMTPRDVPVMASLIFIGGSTEWKWRNLEMWTAEFPRVHLGRCGTTRARLERLEELGCESCDGSGFFRDTVNGRNARQLKAYLSNDKHHQLNMFNSEC